MVKEYLRKLGITFKIFKHDAVFTVEEAKKQQTYNEIRGHTKNLFLKDKGGEDFYLVILSAEKKLDIEKLSLYLSCKLKFANQGELYKILKIKPGCVGPFALINDEELKVKVLIDEEVWMNDFVGFHPNINTETLELNRDDFHRYINSLKNRIEVVKL